MPAGNPAAYTSPALAQLMLALSQGGSAAASQPQFGAFPPALTDALRAASPARANVFMNGFEQGGGQFAPSDEELLTQILRSRTRAMELLDNRSMDTNPRNRGNAPGPRGTAPGGVEKYTPFGEISGELYGINNGG